jgi:hypothetical protein
MFPKLHVIYASIMKYYISCLEPYYTPRRLVQKKDHIGDQWIFGVHTQISYLNIHYRH